MARKASSVPSAKPARKRRLPFQTISLKRPGTVLAYLSVPGRPVPWKAPMIARNGGTPKDKRLVAWQETVALFARQCMGNKPPYLGPVEITFEFSFVKGPYPDATNLQKASEDSLQGIIFGNDRQVCKIQTLVLKKRDRDYATITVSAI